MLFSVWGGFCVGFNILGVFGRGVLFGFFLGGCWFWESFLFGVLFFLF